MALAFRSRRDLGKSFEWPVVEIETVPAAAEINDARSAVYGEGRNAYREERKSNYAFKPIAEQALRPNQLIVPQRLNAALDLLLNSVACLHIVARAASACWKFVIA